MSPKRAFRFASPENPSRGWPHPAASPASVLSDSTARMRTSSSQSRNAAHNPGDPATPAIRCLLSPPGLLRRCASWASGIVHGWRIVRRPVSPRSATPPRRAGRTSAREPPCRCVPSRMRNSGSRSWPGAIWRRGAPPRPPRLPNAFRIRARTPPRRSPPPMCAAQPSTGARGSRRRIPGGRRCPSTPSSAKAIGSPREDSPIRPMFFMTSSGGSGRQRRRSHEPMTCGSRFLPIWRRRDAPPTAWLYVAGGPGPPPRDRSCRWPERRGRSSFTATEQRAT